MKSLHLIPLGGIALLYLSGCTPVVKQPVVEAPPVVAEAIAQVPVTPPAPPPPPEPEYTAPYYPLNPKNFDEPLNPVLKAEVDESLNPAGSIQNTANGAVSSAADQTGATTTALPQATDAALQAQPIEADTASDNATAASEVNSPDRTVSPSNPATPVPSATGENSAANVPATSANTVASNSALNITPPTADPVNAPTASSGSSSLTVATDASSNTLMNQQAVANLKILIPKSNSKTETERFAATANDDEVDVTDIDKDLTLIEGKARHYPTKFANDKERVKAEKRIKELTKQMDVLAASPMASYGVLLRAMKAHVLARNMDVGPDSAFKSAVYFQRLLKLQPNDPETNFWFGFSLSEGGGFRESIPHLDKALKANYQEAYLSMANVYLQLEDKKNAFTMLNNYKIKFPDDAARTDQLIAEIKDGTRYTIWQ